MAAPIPPPPSNAEGLRLHQALTGPDPAATLDFARAYVPHLAGWLATVFRGVSGDLCDDAAARAVFDVLRKPALYNPGRGKTVAEFMQMAAAGDLKNLLAKEGRHRHERLDENVELGPSGGNSREGVLSLMCEVEDNAEGEARVRNLRESLDTVEQAVMDLMLAGERATSRFAEAVGIAHLPTVEQEAGVKKIKDRIKARIKRLGKP